MSQRRCSKLPATRQVTAVPTANMRKGTLIPSSGAAVVMNIGARPFAPTSAPTAPIAIDTARPRASLKPRNAKLIQPSSAPAPTQNKISIGGMVAACRRVFCAVAHFGRPYVGRRTELGKENAHNQSMTRNTQNTQRSVAVTWLAILVLAAAAFGASLLHAQEKGGGSYASITRQVEQ